MPVDAPTLQVDGFAAPEGPNAPLLLDLIDVAVAVYAKDKTTKRRLDSGRGRFRGRTLSLTVPVRRLDFWRDDGVRTQVDDLVRAMTGDDVEISFTKATRAELARNSFRSSPLTAADESADAIVMLSGGLDSAAGALTEIVESRRRVILLSQVSQNAEHESLAVVAELRRAAPRAGVRNVTFSCSVRAKPREPAESTATFLRAAVAAVIADTSGATSIRFYTNGVASFALPITDYEDIAPRPLAPTHPVLLKKIGELLAQVTGLPLAVENPFGSMTKAEVIRRLGEHPRLVAATSSCDRTTSRKREVPFCGVCAHCLERRVAVLAAGMEKHDDAARYSVDPIAGVREAGGDRVLGEAYVRRAQELANATPAMLALRFPLIFSGLSHLGGDADEHARRVADLHRRHGNEVGRALGINTRVYQEESLGRGCVLFMAKASRKKRAKKPEVHKLVIYRDTIKLDEIEVVSKEGFARYPVMKFLAERYCDDYSANTEPESYKYSSITDIADGIPGMEERDVENIRRYVSRLREQITEKYEGDTGWKLGHDEVIEDGKRRGYRLNPLKIRHVRFEIPD